MGWLCINLSGPDALWFQWAGSNSHNNGNPAGDGQLRFRLFGAVLGLSLTRSQAGDAGEGTGGTDRSNILQTMDRRSNFPLRLENATMWDGGALLESLHKCQWAATSVCCFWWLLVSLLTRSHTEWGHVPRAGTVSCGGAFSCFRLCWRDRF